MYIKGTSNKKLIAYIHRVADLLELDTDGVELNFVKSFNDGAAGYCDGDQDFVNIDIARHDAAGKIPTKNIMINIAHEMIHASQIQTGRLENSGLVLRTDVAGNKQLDCTWIWEDQEYVNLAYEDRPWEHEAYDLEETVYAQCL